MVVQVGVEVRRVLVRRGGGVAAKKGPDAVVVLGDAFVERFLISCHELRNFGDSWRWSRALRRKREADALLGFKPFIFHFLRESLVFIRASRRRPQRTRYVMGGSLGVGSWESASSSERE